MKLAQSFYTNKNILDDTRQLVYNIELAMKTLYAW